MHELTENTNFNYMHRVHMVMIINMVHTVTLLAVAINHVKLKSSVQLEYLNNNTSQTLSTYLEFQTMCSLMSTVHNSLVANWTADWPNGAIYKCPALV